MGRRPRRPATARVEPMKLTTDMKLTGVMQKINRTINQQPQAVPGARGSVFISYSSVDEATVEQLSALLRGAGMAPGPGICKSASASVRRSSRPSTARSRRSAGRQRRSSRPGSSPRRHGRSSRASSCRSASAIFIRSTSRRPSARCTRCRSRIRRGWCRCSSVASTRGRTEREASTPQRSTAARRRNCRDSRKAAVQRFSGSMPP